MHGHGSRLSHFSFARELDKTKDPSIGFEGRNKSVLTTSLNGPGGFAVDGSGAISTSSSDRSSAASDQATSIRLRGLKAACLRFCIALLAPKCRGHEYELPMLYAMAVLAVKPQGWRSANEYPPIMSHIIKMARFMIIQMAY